MIRSSRVLLFLLFATTLSAQTVTLTPEMLVDLKRVTDVAVDPAATRIAYILSVPRAASEKRGAPHTELWVMPANGSARRYSLYAEDATAPAFSPDGKRLAFLSKGEGEKAKAQILAVDVDGGAPVAVTTHETSIQSFRWSPDGKTIAFVAEDAKSDEEETADETGRDWQVHDENFKHRRLYTVDAIGGEGKRLIDREVSIWDFEWAPDGKTIFIQSTDFPRTDESYMFRKISAISVDGGKQTVAFTTAGKLGAMEVSPDGRTLAFLGAASLNDPIAQSIYIVPLTGGTPRNLVADYRGSGVDLTWLDARNLLVLVNEGATTRLLRINTETGARTTIGSPAEVIHSIDAAPAKGRFVAVADTPSHPGEVFSGNIADGRLTRMTHHNPQLKQVRLARQEIFQWTSAEGWPIEGILTYPLNYSEGRRYPLVLQIHGGPEGVSQHGWTTSAIYPVQLLALDGYFVLEPNYRGSGGLGVAFSKADHDDLGGREYDDVLRGIDALVAKGLVDGNRVATGGFSYGGYFSAWGATRHSERFKAAIVGAGISNWVSFTGTTDIPFEMSLVHWNSWWFDQPALHWERSPLAHINKAKTPTLIIHGAKDERVHPEQSLELYNALRIKKVPTQLVMYPREPHGVRERAHQLDVIERVRGWLRKYL